MVWAMGPFHLRWCCPGGRGPARRGACNSSRRRNGLCRSPSGSHWLSGMSGRTCRHPGRRSREICMGAVLCFVRYLLGTRILGLEDGHLRGKGSFCIGTTFYLIQRSYIFIFQRYKTHPLKLPSIYHLVDICIIYLSSYRHVYHLSIICIIYLSPFTLRNT